MTRTASRSGRYDFLENHRPGSRGFDFALDLNAKYAKNLIRAVVRRPGLPIEKTNTNQFSDQGRVYESGGYLAIKAITPPGLDESLNVLSLPTDLVTTITIPDDGVTRNVYLKYVETNDEEGTIEVSSSSTTVTGTDTHFTRFKTGMVLEPTDGAVAGEEKSIVADPVNETSLTVDSPFSANASNVHFRVKGDMVGGQTPDYVHYYDHYQIRLDAGDPQPGELKLGEVTKTGGVTTITDTRDSIILEILPTSVMSALHTLLFEGKLHGEDVITVSDLWMPKPLNLELVETSYTDQSDYINPNDIIITPAIKKATEAVQLKSRIRWNFHEVMSGTASDTLQADTGTPFSGIDLTVGYFAWVPSKAKNYEITANTNNSITVDTGGDDLSTITSETIVVHPNAEYYLVTITRRKADQTQDILTRRELIVSNIENGLIDDDRWFLMEMGRHDIAVRAHRGIASSIDNVLSNQLIKLSDIVDDGTLAAVATEYGFNLSIGGWQNAESFEIMVAQQAINWNSDSQFRTITEQRTGITFPVEEAGTFNIGARPLIKGQVVGTPKTTYVTTTGGGARPSSTPIHISVDLLATETTESSRKLAEFREDGSIKIFRMVFDPLGTSGDQSALRIFPKDSPGDAVYFEVTDDATLGPFVFNIDDPLIIPEVNGEFPWIASGYDDRGGADNAKDLHGRWMIYYRYRIMSRSDIINRWIWV